MTAGHTLPAATSGGLRSRSRVALAVAAAWTVWIALLCTQVALTYPAEGQPVDWLMIGVVLINWLLWALLTPPILWVAEHLPFHTDRWKRTLLHHLALGLLAALIHAVLCKAGRIWLIEWVEGPTSPRFGEFRLSLLVLFVGGLWKYWLIFGLYSAFVYYRLFRERELATARLEGELATARLQALEMQLHPHFLFNMLHSVAMLNLVRPEAASRILVKLSDLLRHTLQRSGTHFVTLHQEYDFLYHYLELERVRFEDRLSVQLEASGSCLNALVPNLLLQPLVENAVRHAIGKDSAAGRIVIRAVREDDDLVVTVADDGPGLPAGWTLSSAGVGLRNVHSRLRNLYGTRGILEIARNHPRGALVRVRFPYHAAPPAAADLARMAS